MIEVRLCGSSRLGEADVRVIAESVAQACAVIQVAGGLGDIWGSGFQVAEGLLTARHVVEPYLVGGATLVPTAIIRVVPIKSAPHAAFVDRVEYVSMQYDVAVLPHLNILADCEVGDPATVKENDDIVVIAAPNTLGEGVLAYAASGVVLYKSYITPDLFIYDVPVLPGSSGGPVVTREGKVIGMNVMRLTLPSGKPVGMGIWVSAVQAALKGERVPPEKLSVAVGGVPWTHVVAGGAAAALVYSLIRR